VAQPSTQPPADPLLHRLSQIQSYPSQNTSSPSAPPLFQNEEPAAAPFFQNEQETQNYQTNQVSKQVQEKEEKMGALEQSPYLKLANTAEAWRQKYKQNEKTRAQELEEFRQCSNKLSSQPKVEFGNLNNLISGKTSSAVPQPRILDSTLPKKSNFSNLTNLLSA